MTVVSVEHALAGRIPAGGEVTDSEVDDGHRPLADRVEVSRQQEVRAEPGAGHGQRGAIRSAPSIRIVSPLR